MQTYESSWDVSGHTLDFRVELTDLPTGGVQHVLHVLLDGAEVKRRLPRELHDEARRAFYNFRAQLERVPGIVGMAARQLTIEDFAPESGA